LQKGSQRHRVHRLELQVVSFRANVTQNFGIDVAADTEDGDQSIEFAAQGFNDLDTSFSRRYPK
jgi:hypothetical protein